MTESSELSFIVVVVYGAIRIKMAGVVTMTSSLQIAKFHSPTVKIMFLKKGDRCTVFTIQWWALKHWRALVPATQRQQDQAGKINIGDIYIWEYLSMSSSMLDRTRH